MQNQIVTSASREWTHWLERMSSLRPDEAHPALGAALAQIDASFLLCLEQVEFRSLARRTLGASERFEGHERAELYRLLELDVPPQDIIAADASRFLPDPDERFAQLWSAAACCRFLAAQPAGRDGVGRVRPRASSREKAAASCRTPKLRKFAMRVLPAFDYTNDRRLHDPGRRRPF